MGTSAGILGLVWQQSYCSRGGGSASKILVLVVLKMLVLELAILTQSFIYGSMYLALSSIQLMIHNRNGMVSQHGNFGRLPNFGTHSNRLRADLWFSNYGRASDSFWAAH